MVEPVKNIKVRARLGYRPSLPDSSVTLVLGAIMYALIVAFWMSRVG